MQKIYQKIVVVTTWSIQNTFIAWKVSCKTFKKKDANASNSLKFKP